MLEIICNIICIFLLIIGTVEIARILILSFLNVKNKSDAVIVIPIREHDEEAELLLRSAVTRARWLEFNMNQNIICLDCGMDSETRRICQTICEDYEFMRICKPYELYDVLNQR